MHRSLKETNITYFVLLVGQLVFAGIVVYLINNDQSEPFDVNSIELPIPFHLITPALMLGGITIAFLLNQQRNKQAERYNFELPRKLMHYKTSVLLRSSILEGVNLFSVIAALVSHNISYLYYFVFGILVFLYFRPSFANFSTTYKLSASELGQIR